MKRLKVEPLPDIGPAPRAYRCIVCRAVIPWTLWTREQQAAWEWDGTKPQCCEGCEGKGKEFEHAL